MDIPYPGAAQRSSVRCEPTPAHKCIPGQVGWLVGWLTTCAKLKSAVPSNSLSTLHTHARTRLTASTASTI